MNICQNCKVATLLFECYIIVEVLSQNTEYLFWLYFVTFEWNRPNDAEDCAEANCMFMV